MDSMTIFKEYYFISTIELLALDWSFELARTVL